jgi:hypothetical protein
MLAVIHGAHPVPDPLRKVSAVYRAAETGSVCGKGWWAVSVFLPHVLNIHRRISAIA